MLAIRHITRNEKGEIISDEILPEIYETTSAQSEAMKALAQKHDHSGYDCKQDIWWARDDANRSIKYQWFNSVDEKGLPKFA